MEIRLLGPVELVAGDGRPGRLSGPKERALLALLAVNAGHVVPEARMLEAVWSDEPPRTARRTLQAYLSRLRRALTDAGLPPGAALDSRPGGWQLTLSPGITDVGRAEKLVTQARAA